MWQMLSWIMLTFGCYTCNSLKTLIQVEKATYTIHDLFQRKIYCN